MTRQNYLFALVGLALTLILLRVSLPPYSASGVLFGRLQQISIFVGLCVYVLPVLVGLRAIATGLSGLWAAPMFFWLVGAEPLLRQLGGAEPYSGLASQPESWIELVILAAILIGFLVVFTDRQQERLSPNGQFLERMAGWIAILSIIMRPFVCFGTLSRVPVIGDYIYFSGENLTDMLRVENVMTGIKGLFLGWTFVGNSLIVLGFAACLALLWYSEFGARVAISKIDSSRLNAASARRRY